MFTRAGRGEAVEWDDVYGAYAATVDFPGCVFWRELMAAYPDAPVLLSVRDPEAWVDSFLDTIGPAFAGELTDAEEYAPWNEMTAELGRIAFAGEYGGPRVAARVVPPPQRRSTRRRGRRPPDRVPGVRRLGALVSGARCRGARRPVPARQHTRGMDARAASRLVMLIHGGSPPRRPCTRAAHHRRARAPRRR